MMTINHFHCYELQIIKINYNIINDTILLQKYQSHAFIKYLQDVLLEVEWMACELVCEAATVAKLPALVVAM